MNIQIIRYRKLTETIDGHLFIDGQRICDTAENAITALKAGTYPIVITKCQFHSRKMPCVMITTEYQPPCSICSKSDCVGINSTPHKGGDGGGLLICHMLKPGNGVYKRTDGSIILGTYLAPGCLTHPREAFADFYDRIRKSIERGHALTITIVENYPQPRKHELTNFEMGQQILRQF